MLIFDLRIRFLDKNYMNCQLERSRIPKFSQFLRIFLQNLEISKKYKKTLEISKKILDISKIVLGISTIFWTFLEISRNPPAPWAMRRAELSCCYLCYPLLALHCWKLWLLGKGGGPNGQIRPHPPRIKFRDLAGSPRSPSDPTQIRPRALKSDPRGPKSNP